MNKASSLLISGVGLALGLTFSTPTLAYFQQSQSQKVEQTVTAEVEGSGKSKVESSQKVEQSQSQNMDMGWGNNGYRLNRKQIRYYNVKSENTDGEAYLSWGWRGGTCHIRYTENNYRNYKYSTSAACDDGHLTIGGLQPGRLYRFQVRQDNGVWSKPIRIKAS